MSNPGVIKLAELNIDKRRIWLDDNIGESIHIHIDQLRIDLTIKEFENLCGELRNVLTSLIDKCNFDANEMDARFMHDNAEKLLNIESIEIEEVDLGTLQVPDDAGVTFLKDSVRVKALMGLIDINKTKQRNSNFSTQTNRERLEDCLQFVKGNGYPVNNNYILVSDEKKVILDGWHRAACLYYLKGETKVPVKVIKFREGTIYTPFYFPIEKVKSQSRIIIYGAGSVGQSYFKQLNQGKYANVIAWVDKKYNEIINICNFDIKNPDIVINEIYDYVVIAVLDAKIKREIHDWLREKGVPEEKIVE